MSTIYSHSRLSSFENCPKKFEFRYILDVEAETEGIEAFVGKRVHEILERLYQFVEDGMVPPLEKVLKRYDAFWEEHWDADRVRISPRRLIQETLRCDLDKERYAELVAEYRRTGRQALVQYDADPSTRTNHPALVEQYDERVETYREIGRRCLRGYYSTHYPFDADETLGIEDRVLFDLDEKGEYSFQGIIDRLVRASDGAIEIHDYKTGNWVPGQKQLDQDRQLALYQLGVEKRYGTEAPVRLVWHYLARGRRETSSRTPSELAELRQQTIDVIDTIGRQEKFEAKKNTLCDWCEYRNRCPAWGDDPAAAGDA